MASKGNINSDIRLCDMIVDILSNTPKGLTVSQIYAFLNKDKLFDPADNSWKGNVRHILSKKKYFLKSDYKESYKRGKFWVFDRKQYNKSRQVKFMFIHYFWSKFNHGVPSCSAKVYQSILKISQVYLKKMNSLNTIHSMHYPHPPTMHIFIICTTRRRKAQTFFPTLRIITT